MALSLRLLIFSLLISNVCQADWLRYYMRDCKKVKYNHVCIQNLLKDFDKMSEHEPTVEYYLDLYDLPVWLKFIPIIESRYNRFAVSERDDSILALGMWQIAPKNFEKFCKLSDKFNCDRVTIYSQREIWQNAEITTNIACWILSGLYDKYKNWDYVLKAYNAGGKRIDQWLKGDELPDETVHYTKQLLAIQEIYELQRTRDIWFSW